MKFIWSWQLRCRGAALNYFDKPLSDLTVAEAAYLRPAESAE